MTPTKATQHTPRTTQLTCFCSPQVDDGENPLGFSQCFQLQQDGAGQWYVYNDLFKLVMG